MLLVLLKHFRVVVADLSRGVTHVGEVARVDAMVILPVEEGLISTSQAGDIVWVRNPLLLAIDARSWVMSTRWKYLWSLSCW